MFPYKLVADGSKGSPTCSLGELDNANTLPKGIKKEILTSGDDKGQSPCKGDDCMVHYVARMQGHTDEFDSSRERGQAFTFELGAGDVFLGWDIAVANMRRCEVARFTFEPEYAYGEHGAQPNIPANATLVVEIQLIAVRAADDLFADGGVIRTKLRQGSDCIQPEEGSEVLISFKASASDGRVLEERSDVEYVVGSRDLGPLARIICRALEDMRTGAMVSLRCSPEYTYDDATHGDVCVELTLVQVYQISDVSPAKDKSIVKKTISNGIGIHKPHDGSSVRLTVVSATDANGGIIPGFIGRTELEITTGNGDVCDALEYAVVNMLEKEKAIVTCLNPINCVDRQLGLADIASNACVDLTVELVGFDNGKSMFDMSVEEHLLFAAMRKAVGNALYKSLRYSLAVERYQGVKDYLDCFAVSDSDAIQLITDCELNKAQCLLKLDRNAEARDCCTNVIKDDPANVKAIFRRGSAQLRIGDFSEAIADFHRVLEIEPSNDAQRMLSQAKTAQKREGKDADSMFAGMNKGLAGFGDAEEKRVKDQKDAKDAAWAKTMEENRPEAEKWCKMLDNKRNGVPQCVDDTVEALRREARRLAKDPVEDQADDSDIGFLARKAMGNDR